MLNPTHVKKILLINLAFIGDVVLSTPAARALKKAYPEAKIHLMVIPANELVAWGNPYVDKVIVYDKRGSHRKLGMLWRLIKSLRSEKYDLAVAMNFSLRSAVMAWISGAAFRLGYDAQHASVFLTHVAASSRKVIKHETENYLALLEPLGIYANDSRLEFKIDSITFESLESKVTIDNRRPLVLICPFGRNPLNSLDISVYSEIIRELTQTTNCMLIGGKAEKPALEAVNAQAGGAAKVLAGVLTLEELAALLSNAALLITVDTGPLHIAGAVGTPILSVFSRSDHRVWGPRGTRDIIIHHETECWPCYQTECSHHKCTSCLTADEIVTAALRILSEFEPQMD
jgi:lipopolysaccharide heptosyltransferase II